MPAPQPSPSKVAKTHARDVGADSKNLFTRTQAARFCGVTKGAIEAAERRGALTAIVIQGVHVFPRSELERYRGGTQRGELAARAFRLLGDGANAARLVAELEVTPELALELVRQFAELGEYVLCASPKGSRAAWRAAFGVELRPELVLRALELAARTPSLRSRLLGT